jgi:hypothetical protein
MSVKYKLNSDPSVTFTTNIDWSLGDVFIADIDSNPTLTFSNDTDGNKIIIKLANTSATVARTVTWPTNVVILTADKDLAAGYTKIFSLVKVGNTVYATLDFSATSKLVYNTAGTYSITIPAGNTKMQAFIIPACGGGGGGGGTAANGAGGGGGGYGQQVSITTQVNVNDQFTIIVGAGGSKGDGGNYNDVGGSGSNGGLTSIKKNIDNSIILSASGGLGGGGGGLPEDNPAQGGAGGQLGGQDGKSRTGGWYDDCYGGTGGINPDYNDSRGGNGGASNHGSPAQSGTKGTDAIVIINLIP